MSGSPKTAIVTGASQGIGAGIVKGFVERGFNVIANSRKITQSTEVAASTVVKMDSAMGSFTLHKHSAKPAVFLAGGIGITPFSSIVRQADHDHAPHRLYLFYSNRRPEDAPFIEVLQNLEKTNPNFRFIATMTEMSGSKKTWNGETGRINREMLSKHLNDLRGPIYYIAGPPAMVSGMRKMLVASGVDEDDIRTDEFAGY